MLGKSLTGKIQQYDASNRCIKFDEHYHCCFDLMRERLKIITVIVFSKTMPAKEITAILIDGHVFVAG